MKTLNRVLIVLTTLLLVVLGSQVPKAHALFDQMNAPMSVSGILIGEFTLPVTEWDPDKDYEIGDRFTYNGALWEVRAEGDYTQPPEGAVLQPFGIYQEITDEYRSYNTYFEGDIVVYNGIEYEAIYGGMSGQTPGTVEGWQAINTTEWQPFNVYNQGDIVTYNGIEYERLYDGSVGDEPGTAVGWQAINTTEWQPFNVYQEGDIVTYNGLEYERIHGSNSGDEPGTVVGWNVINSDDWYFYNVYNDGDTVIYNGNTYEANYYTQGNVPEGNNVGQWAQWRLIQAVIDPGQTTHEFDNNVLNATITLNDVVIVEDGVINTANAASIGITVSKQPQGATYWQFEGNGRLRIRTNGTIAYQQNFTFDSLVVDLP